MKRPDLGLLGALALLVAAALLTPAVRVAAHAAFDHSTPAKDEVVSAAPGQVDVYFKQSVAKVTGQYYVRVFADNGTTQTGTGDGTVDDANRKHMSAALPASAPQGRYIVKWHTVSDVDGDPDSGAFCFYVGVQPTAAQQVECASFAPTPVTIVAPTQTSPAGTQAATVTPVATKAVTSAGSGSSSTGVIVGVVVGVIVVVVIVGGAGLWWQSRRG